MASTIVIYGGYGAIGSALGRMLVQQGHTLHLVGRREEQLTTIADELKASYTVGDVHDTTLYSRASEEAGQPIDGLVYAIGTINLGNIRRLTREDFLGDFEINAMGAALAIQAALPALKKSKENPSVLLFSSVAALQGFTFHASMGMAKGAVSGLTLSLAAELAPKIRVNAIAPSLTQTPLAQGILANKQMASSLASLHPMQRLGTAGDIAALAAYLLSSEAQWITGQIIGVDGGRSTLRTAN